MRRDNKLLYAVVISDGSERWRIVQDEASVASWKKELCLEQRLDSYYQRVQRPVHIMGDG